MACIEFKKLVKGPGKPPRDSRCATCGIVWTDHPRTPAPGAVSTASSIKVGNASPTIEVTVFGTNAEKMTEAAKAVQTCPKCFFAYVNEHICGNPFASTSTSGSTTASAPASTPAPAAPKEKKAPHTSIDPASCHSYERSVVARGRIGFDNPCKHCKVIFGEHHAPVKAEKPVEAAPGPPNTPKVDCGNFRRQIVARGRVPSLAPCANCGVVYMEHGEAADASDESDDGDGDKGTGFTFSSEESPEFRKNEAKRMRNLHNIGVLEEVLSAARFAVGDVENGYRVWWLYEACEGGMEGALPVNYVKEKQAV